MDASKSDPVKFLIALAILGVVATRMTLEFLAPGLRNSGRSRCSEEKDVAAIPNNEGDQGGHPASGPTSEERIKERAFQIWLDEGKPEGRHHEHWKMAEAQILE